MSPTIQVIYNIYVFRDGYIIFYNPLNLILQNHP